MAQVEIENLGKCYRSPGEPEVWALRGASLSIPSGELLVLLGPSGAGKTTLLRLLAGLETATAGAIRFDGQLMNDVEPAGRDVAMVFQNHALYPHLTAYDNMALGLRLRKTPRAEIERRVGEATEMLGLASCLDRKPSALSGGESQRVALGRALVRQPKVLLLDEPFSDLDAPRRLRIRADLIQLHQRLGLTLVCATHDQADALAMGKRLAVLAEGLVQQVGTPATLYRRPANLFVAGFLGTPPMNLLPGALVSRAGQCWFESETRGPDGATALGFPLTELKNGALTAGTERKVICGLRPEHIRCVPASGSADRLGFGIVERVELAGADVHVHARLPGEPSGRVVVREPAGTGSEPGERIGLACDVREALLFDPDTGLNLLT